MLCLYKNISYLNKYIIENKCLGHAWYLWPLHIPSNNDIWSKEENHTFGPKETLEESKEMNNVSKHHPGLCKGIHGTMYLVRVALAPSQRQRTNIVALKLLLMNPTKWKILRRTTNEFIWLSMELCV